MAFVYEQTRPRRSFQCFCSQYFSPPLSGALLFTVPILTTTAAVLFPSSAQAVSFRFDFGNNVSSDFQKAAEAAGEVWSAELKDDVVVDLRVELTDLSVLGGDILGGAQPGKLTVSYQDYLDATVRDVVSSNDYLSLNSFQLSSDDRTSIQNSLSRPGQRNKFKADSREFSFLLDNAFSSNHRNDSSYFYDDDDNDDDDDFYYYQYDDDDDDDDHTYVSRYNPNSNRNQRRSSKGFIDNNKSNNNKNIVVTSAQAKALDLIRPSTRGLDAVIKINSQVNWDFDRADGVDDDRYDLASVLQHEIGHALGIVSGVDALDFLSDSGQQDAAEDVDDNRVSYLTPMDYSRYSSESENMGVMDLTFGGEKYFSLDRGRTAVRDASGRPVYFSTGSFFAGGDGYQGSHWQENNRNPFGVMNPTLQRGRFNSISNVDLTLLDTIGWDLQDSTAVRARAIGVDWQGLQDYVNRERGKAVRDTMANWGKKISGLETTNEDVSVEVDLEFARWMQDRFDTLDELLQYENSSRRRRGLINWFYWEVITQAKERDQRLKALPQEILTVDDQAREWFSLSTYDLADRMRQASPMEINRLSNLVKTASAEERAIYEPKLEAAIAHFADQPSQLVQELLDTSGPANPIAYGFKSKWWFYFNLGGEDVRASDNSSLVYYSDMAYLTAAQIDVQPDVQPDGALRTRLQPVSDSALSLATFKTNYQGQTPKDVPEPGSVLALFGIAVLSAGAVRRCDH